MTMLLSYAIFGLFYLGLGLHYLGLGLLGVGVASFVFGGAAFLINRFLKSLDFDLIRNAFLLGFFGVGFGLFSLGLGYLIDLIMPSIEF